MTNPNNNGTANNNGSANGTSGQFDIFRMLSGGIGGIFSMFFNLLIVGVIGFLIYQIPGVKNMVDGWLEDNPDLRAMLDQMGIRPDPQASFQALNNRTAEQAYELLTGDRMNVPDAIANVLTSDANNVRDNDAWRENLRILNQACNGRLSMQTLTSPRALTYLMTDPQASRLGRRILAAVPRPAPGTAPDAMTTAILASIRGILADEAQFNALFTPENREMVIGAIKQFCPIPFREGALEAFITGPIGMNGGVPTATLRNFLSATLEGGGSSMPAQALIDLIRSPEVGTPAGAESLAALMRSVDTANMPAGMTSAAPMFSMLSSVQNVNAVRTLMTSLGDRAPQLIAAMQAPAAQRIQAFENFLLHEENRDAALLFADQVDISTLPADMQDSMRRLSGFSRQTLDAALPLMAGLREAEARAREIQQAGGPAADITLAPIREIAEGQMPREPRVVFRMLLNPAIRDTFTPEIVGPMLTAMLEDHRREPARNRLNDDDLRMLRFFTARDQGGRYVNLEAFSTMAAGLDNDFNKATDASANRFKDVMHGLVLFISTGGNPTALHGLDQQELSQFFAHPANRDAFGTFLRNLNVSALPPEQQTLVRTLRNHWRDREGHGLSEMLSTVRGAEFVLKALRGENVFAWGDVVFDGIRLGGNGAGVLWDNQAHLQALQQTIESMPNAGRFRPLSVTEAREIGAPGPTPNSTFSNGELGMAQGVVTPEMNDLLRRSRDARIQ